MTRRIDEHAPVVGSWLLVDLQGPSGDHGGFCHVEVVDFDVEVCLLWPFTGWPGRRLMVVDALEGDRAARGVQFDPVVVDFVVDLTADDRLVERGQSSVIAAVERDEFVPTDRRGHRPQR